MKYAKIRLSKKSDKHILLNDIIIGKVPSSVIEKIQELNKCSITVVKNVQYDVGAFLRTKVDGATIETIEQYDNDVHVTYFKNNDHHTIVVPKSLVNKKVYDEVRISYRELSYVDRDLLKEIYTSNELDELKDNEILLKL